MKSLTVKCRLDPYSVPFKCDLIDPACEIKGTDPFVFFVFDYLILCGP